MLNKYYSMPLHGVECVLKNNTSNKALPFAVFLDFESIDKKDIGQPVWTLNDVGTRYATTLSLHKHSPHFYLKVDCEGQGLFKFNQNQISINWSQPGTDSAHYFQTVGLAVWLELQNILCIHGNALEYKNQAIALVAPSGTGKSTLSANLSEHGFSWMTDDMMALHPSKNKQQFKVYPSWPIARMWPDSVQSELGIDHKTLTKVHHRFNKRQIELNNATQAPTQGSELTTIYLLNRVESATSACSIKTVNSSQALITLLQNSILGDAYQALGLEQTRVKAISELLHRVTVKQITYVNGSHNLNIVRNCIVSDLNKA